MTRGARTKTENGLVKPQLRKGGPLIEVNQIQE